MQPKYLELFLDEDVRRWFENLGTKSVLTETMALRNIWPILRIYTDNA